MLKTVKCTCPAQLIYRFILQFKSIHNDIVNKNDA